MAALKAVLASKADVDALPEALRSLYKETNGKFVLDAEGVEDVSGLRTALEKERGGRADLDKTLKELKAQFEGLDPVKAREALQKIQSLEDKKLIDEGKIEELLKTRTERLVADHTAQVNAFNKQIEELKGGNGKLTSQLSELLIDNAVRSAAGKLGLRDTAVEDAVLNAKQLYQIRDGKPVPVRGDQVVYGKDANTPMPIDEWLGGLQKDKAHWFKESTGAGTPPGGGNLPGLGGSHTITAEQARNPQVYQQARAAAEKAGVELQIAQQ